MGMLDDRKPGDPADGTARIASIREKGLSNDVEKSAAGRRPGAVAEAGDGQQRGFPACIWTRMRKP